MVLEDFQEFRSGIWIDYSSPKLILGIEYISENYEVKESHSHEWDW